MGSDPMEVVNRWRTANFEREAVEEVLADDVEWVVPQRDGATTLRGIDAVLGWYGGGGATDDGAPEGLGGLEVTEERGELEDFGDGRVGSVNRLVYAKESGEVAHVTTHRLVYSVCDGKIVRYELESLDEPEIGGH